MSFLDAYHNMDQETKNTLGDLENERVANQMMPELSDGERRDVEHDMMMLVRIEKYRITDKHMKMINHIIDKVPAENKDTMMRNYIHGIIAGAVMDYENVHVRKRSDIKTWFPE